MADGVLAFIVPHHPMLILHGPSCRVVIIDVSSELKSRFWRACPDLDQLK